MHFGLFTKEAPSAHLQYDFQWEAGKWRDVSGAPGGAASNRARPRETFTHMSGRNSQPPTSECKTELKINLVIGFWQHFPLCLKIYWALKQKSSMGGGVGKPVMYSWEKNASFARDYVFLLITFVDTSILSNRKYISEKLIWRGVCYFWSLLRLQRWSWVRRQLIKCGGQNSQSA